MISYLTEKAYILVKNKVQTSS